MNKYLYGLTEIIKFLIQQPYFKIYLFHQKTNYNLDNQTLYLNYSDIYETMIFLKQMTKNLLEEDKDYYLGCAHISNYNFKLAHFRLRFKPKRKILSLYQDKKITIKSQNPKIIKELTPMTDDKNFNNF